MAESAYTVHRSAYLVRAARIAVRELLAGVFGAPGIMHDASTAVLAAFAVIVVPIRRRGRLGSRNLVGSDIIGPSDNTPPCPARIERIIVPGR